MADTYEKDLAQKSSLTTSDFIRVVGSDNVSYKQQVSDVKDAFGVAVYHIEYAETASTSGTRYYSPSISGAIDSIATKGAGRYMVECIRSTSYSDTYSNITSSNMTLIVDVLGASYINVIGIQLNNNISAGDIILKRAKSPTWGGWIKMPTRAEVDDAHRYKGDVSVDDFNSLTETGIYFAKGKSTTLNPPIPSIPGRYYQLLVTNADGMITQFATSHNDPNTIYSRDSVGGSTWTAWTKQPTRAEITAVKPLHLGNTVDSMLSALQSVWDSGGQIVLFTCGSSLTNILTKGQASVSGKGIVTLLGDPSVTATNIDFLLYTGAMELFTARYSTASSSIDIAKKATMTNL